MALQPCLQVPLVSYGRSGLPVLTLKIFSARFYERPLINFGYNWFQFVLVIFFDFGFYDTIVIYSVCKWG